MRVADLAETSPRRPLEVPGSPATDRGSHSAEGTYSTRCGPRAERSNKEFILHLITNIF